MRLISTKTVGILLVAALVGAAAWTQIRAQRAKAMASPKQARMAGKELPVRTVQISRTSVVDVVGATAVTTASQTALIQIGASREFLDTDLVLTKVNVWEGKRVSAGEVLFELDSTVFAAVLAEKQEALVGARAELERVEHSTALDRKVRDLELSSADAEIVYRNDDLKRRKDNLEHYTRLFASSSANIIEYGEAVVAHADAVFRLADAERRRQKAADLISVGVMQDAEALANSRQRVAEATFGVKIAQRDLERCKIVSPLEGLADAVSAVPGTVVGFTSPLTHIHDLDPIHVRVDFPQERIADVAIGQQAEIVLDSFRNEKFAGKVIRIAPAVTPETRVLPVVVEIPNPDWRIKPGISGFARIQLSRDALMVPSTALLRQGSAAMVFRVEAGRARMREVRTGTIVADGQTEVTDGLSSNDEVVIYGVHYLRDDDAIDANWRRWAQRDE